MVVFLDGHVSHLSLQLSTFCKENQIEVCCIPSHATHILQPLDVAVFFPLKQKWKTLVRNLRIENEGNDIQKHQVPSLLSRIINEVDFTATIKSGFKTCGLYPFDENAVNYTKCIQENKQHGGTNTQREISEPARDTITHRLYVESKIDPDTLRRFEETRISNAIWQDDERHAALYDLWTKIVDDETEQPTNNAPDSSLGSSSVEPSALMTVDNFSVEDVLDFPFPEFVTPGVNSSKYRKNS